VAAAIPNPGMSAWLSLKERAGLVPGETVFINGATGVAGRIAVQAARHLGAKKVIGAGRNLDSLRVAALDSTIQLNQPEDDIRKALAAELEQGVDVIVDYLWGRPAELILEALAKSFRPDRPRSVRMVQIGDVAGKTITLPGATLRSVDLKLFGSGFGSVSVDRVWDAIPNLFSLAARGEFTIDIERIPLRDVESAWNRKTEGRRIVFVP
jgi:NADPH:quinone reductase-like Zn-dependent oxidoreductase